MRQAIIIIFLAIAMMAFYKHQHVQPVQDPKDSPLFHETLERSLNKFRKDEVVFRKDETKFQQNQGKLGKKEAEAKAQAQAPSKAKHARPSPGIDIANSPQKGRDDAPITLVVFTDFKCVHCSDWAKTLNEIMQVFPNDVKIIFKNFPLPFSKPSKLAAKAALAAKEQGKFWEMHDLLFKNREALDKKNLMAYAQALGMDMPEFQKSLEKEELATIIAQDRAQGQRLGITGAPTSFVNGMRITGAQPVSYIKELIKKMLGIRN